MNGSQQRVWWFEMACFGQGLAQVDGYHGEIQENGQNRGGK